MVKIEIANQKITRASAWLNEVEDLLSKPQATTREKDLAAFYLFLVIQECIDLATHWIADAGWPPADDAGSSFDVLSERKIIDTELAQKLRRATGLRNRIAHGYAGLDYPRLIAEAPEGTAALRKFLSIVMNASMADDT